MIQRLLLLSIFLFVPMRSTIAAEPGQDPCDAAFMDANRSSKIEAETNENRFKSLQSLVEPLLQFSQSPVRVGAADATDRYFTKSLFWIGDRLVDVARFVSPIPPPRAWMKSINLLFLRLEENPLLVLTSDEKTLLQQYRADSRFERRREYLHRYPKLSKVRRAAAQIGRTMKLAVLALSLNMAVSESALLNTPVTVEQFLSQEAFQPKENEVQLLNETFPFPHLALRIGSTVYSYGRTSMHASPVEVYLRDRQTLFAAGRGFQTEKSFRSVQVMTLRLPRQKVVDLTYYLTFQDGKIYRNITHVNDCSSMILKALDTVGGVKVGSWVDPSPSLSLMVLNAGWRGGDAEVVGNRLVRMGEDQNELLHLMRNAFINSLEAETYLAWASLKQATRTYYDAFEDRNPNSRYTPGTVAEMRSWNDDVAREVFADPEIQLFLSSKSQIVGDPKMQSEVRGRFKELYDFEYGRLESGQLTVSGILGIYYRLQILFAVEKDLLGTTQGDFYGRVRNPILREQLAELIWQIQK